jgi:hypothetical protein
MSTLRVNTIQNSGGTGSPAINGLAAAWVNFNGSGTVAIRGSSNISSITDNGTGRYTANFTTALPNANYAAVTSNANRDGGCYSFTTTSVGIFAGESPVDSTDISLAVFR